MRSDQKQVTLKATCIGTIRETWTFWVPLDWEQGKVDNFDILESLDLNPGVEFVDVTSEVSDEQDRVVTSVEVYVNTSLVEEPAGREIRASEIEVGQTVREYGMDSSFVVDKLGEHGDTVLITTPEGDEHSLDIDTVVEVRP